MHGHNSFVTLTYDDEHLPPDGSVSIREFQLFMKRLRKQLGLGSHRIRYFGCGEYGDRGGRPHYHALIFGHDFPDKLKVYTPPGDPPLYQSEALRKVWPYGNNTIGEVNYTTASYVAHYCIKKITGDMAKDHYLRPHPVTGHLHQVHPEFAVQSRRPGIGASWYDKFKSDCFPSDFLVVDGHKVPVPRYYTLKLTEEEATPIKRARKRAAVRRKDDNTPERRKVRETVLTLKIQSKKARKALS